MIRLPLVDRDCGTCSRTFRARQSRIRKGKDKYCSRKCSGKAEQGENHPNWGGGKTENSHGYILSLVKDHPRASANRGYVFEHILIAERALGKFLPAGAEVHHSNEIKGDNRNQNLVICQDRSYHRLLHYRKRIIDHGGRPGIDQICSGCKEVKKLYEFNIYKHGIYGYGSTCKACKSQYHFRKKSNRRNHLDRRK